MPKVSSRVPSEFEPQQEHVVVVPHLRVAGDDDLAVGAHQRPTAGSSSRPKARSVVLEVHVARAVGVVAPHDRVAPRRSHRDRRRPRRTLPSPSSASAVTAVVATEVVHHAVRAAEGRVGAAVGVQPHQREVVADGPTADHDLAVRLQHHRLHRQRQVGPLDRHRRTIGRALPVAADPGHDPVGHRRSPPTTIAPFDLHLHRGEPVVGAEARR